MTKHAGDEWPVEAPDSEVELEAEEGREYFAMIMYDVLDRTDVTRNGKNAYVCIVRGLGWRKDKRHQKITRADLAKVMGISTDTLDRGIKNLEACGIVTVIRERDPATGNWKTSRYILKDNRAHRLAARVLELELENSKLRATQEEKPQVTTSPQNAAPTEADNPDEGGNTAGDQSADCGMVPTCDDVDSAQVATSPQDADPPSRNMRNGRAADCGHTRESSCSCKREKQREERSPVTAVGGPTVRTGPVAVAPLAQPKISLAANLVLARIRRYRLAPEFARARWLGPLTEEALTRFGRDAIVRYALMVIGEGAYLEHQHAPEFRAALERLGRDAARGDACRECGQTPGECPCRAAEAPPSALVDAPWSAQDQAGWLRTLEHLGVDEADLVEAREADAS